MFIYTESKTAVSRFVCALLISCLVVLPAQAALVSTASLVDDSPAISAPPINRSNLAERVETHLVELGVSPADAQSRLAVMSDEELVALNTALDDAPAGGSFLAIAAIVFLVLLFTDIMGYTDLFPFVKKSPDGNQGPVVTEEN